MAEIMKVIPTICQLNKEIIQLKRDADEYVHIVVTTKALFRKTRYDEKE